MPLIRTAILAFAAGLAVSFASLGAAWWGLGDALPRVLANPFALGDDAPPLSPFWAAFLGMPQPPLPEPRMAVPVMPVLSSDEWRSQAAARRFAVSAVLLSRPLFQSARVQGAIDAEMGHGVIPAGGRFAFTATTSPIAPLVMNVRRPVSAEWAVVASSPGTFPGLFRVGALFHIGVPCRIGETSIPMIRPLFSRKATRSDPVPDGGGSAAVSDAWDQLVEQVRVMVPLPAAAYPSVMVQSVSPSDHDSAALLGDGRGVRKRVRDALSDAPVRFCECGVALYFPAPDGAAISAAMALARRVGRPAIAKWAAAPWGDHHSTVMQSIIPVTGAAQTLRSQTPILPLAATATADQPLGMEVDREGSGPGEYVNEFGQLVVEHEVTGI
jgi:hypothetical protein